MVTTQARLDERVDTGADKHPNKRSDKHPTRSQAERALSASRHAAQTSTAAVCPCGGQPVGARYGQCCGRLIDGQLPARDASELMRSRYTAYALQDHAYLRRTWHPDTCPVDLEANVDAGQKTHWLGLTVKRSAQLDATHAEVEFIARYKIGGRAYRLHEISRFERTDDQWRYVDGDLLT